MQTTLLLTHCINHRVIGSLAAYHLTYLCLQRVSQQMDIPAAVDRDSSFEQCRLWKSSAGCEIDCYFSSCTERNGFSMCQICHFKFFWQLAARCLSNGTLNLLRHVFFDLNTSLKPTQCVQWQTNKYILRSGTSVGTKFTTSHTYYMLICLIKLNACM